MLEEAMLDANLFKISMKDIPPRGFKGPFVGRWVKYGAYRANFEKCFFPKKSNLLPELSEVLMSLKHETPFQHADPNKEFKDKYTEKLRIRKYDEDVIETEASLRWLKAIACPDMPAKTGDFYNWDREAQEWKHFSDKDLHMNTGILRQHVKGWRILGSKKTSKTTNVVIIKVKGSCAFTVANKVIKRLHGNYEGVRNFRINKPSLSFKQGEDEFRFYYCFDEHIPIKTVKLSLEYVLKYMSEYKDYITILPDGITIEPLPFNTDCQLTIFKNLLHSPWECTPRWQQIKESRVTLYIHKHFRNIVPKVISKEEDMPKNPPPLPGSKTTRIRQKEKVRYTINQEELFPELKYVVLSKELNMMEKYCKKSEEFKMFTDPYYKNKAYGEANCLRLLLYVYIILINVIENGGITHAIPSNLLKKITSRYGRAWNQVVRPLFLDLTKNYSTSLWKGRCREFNLTKLVSIRREFQSIYNIHTTTNTEIHVKYMIIYYAEYANMRRKRSSKSRSGGLDKLFKDNFDIYGDGDGGPDVCRMPFFYQIREDEAKLRETQKIS